MPERLKLSHNDEPSLLDSFGHETFLREVCEQVSSCDAPKGIGINGYWGMGKTTFLKQIYFQLTNSFPEEDQVTKTEKTALFDPAIQPIWFEAWRFQQDGLPIVALLNEIRSQMGLAKRFQESAKKAAGIALLGSISAFDEVIKAASGGIMAPKLGQIAGIGESWEKSRHQYSLPSQSIRNLLQEAINHALGKNKKRLVIFIDDLDRCEPQTAFRLLEGIKVYLNLNNCVVLFGMDQRQIEKALSESLKLSNETQASHRAREYLEKICQDVHYIPLPDQQKKAAFFMQRLRELEHPQSNVVLDELDAALQMYDCLPANPRKIKILVNRVALMLRQLKPETLVFRPFEGREEDGINRQFALLLSVAIFHCYHPSIYEQLNKQPAYLLEVFDRTTGTALDTKREEQEGDPMRGIIWSQKAGKELAVNPSDSNVFRLHRVMEDLKGYGNITANDVLPFILS